MKIESKDTDIESLLDSSFFHIPRFQRPYSWDNENITEFWEDIVTNAAEDYFIGSMVVFKKSKQNFGIVDGQQRLTTITILLCTIRDNFLKLNNENLAKGLHQLIERNNRNNSSEYVLKSETSFPYFQEHIQKFSTPELSDNEIQAEEIRLQKSHQLFNRLIDKSLASIDSDPTILDDSKEQEKIKKLIALRDSILNLNVILITLDNEDDAYLIFETLNTRGKDLSLTDLVKNHFLKLLKAKDEVDAIKRKWNKVLDTVVNSSAEISLDKFIYHFWASRKEYVTLKKLFPKIKKEVKKTNAKEYLDFLVSDSEIYRSIHETDYNWNKGEREISKTLSALQLFKLSQPTPAVLSLIRAYKNKIIKTSKLRDSLKIIENFHFIFTTVTSSRSSGGIYAMYSAFARKLYEATSSQEAALEIRSLTQKLREKIPSFDEFKVAFREIYFTKNNSKQKLIVRYILGSFCEYYSYKFPVDLDDLTIEHIHPQEDIDCGIWDECHIGRLGNLMFLDQKMNEKLKTKPFKEKKALLQENSYTVPQFINNQCIWSPKEVDEHTDDMAFQAYNYIWKI